MHRDPQPLTVGVPAETLHGEYRVALAPKTVDSLRKAGFAVLVQSGAGVQAGFPDAEYSDKGATIVPERADVYEKSTVVVQVRACGANAGKARADLEFLRPGQTLIAQCDPLSHPDAIRDAAAANAQIFALEMLPRITRAQSMDVLSSMATVAGYKAVLVAASHLPRMFPMLMTAAGTITPARVFVIGAGVAGLQAIATAKRLGALVEAFDVRPAVKEQVESLGARFVEVELETGSAEQSGGYAKQMGDDFYQKQRELTAKVVASSSVVITTAAIPGKPAPKLITAEMVAGMSPGSVIVDLAAERGGNCELTRADETVIKHGVTILGPTNLPATVPYHASEMYSKNVSTFLLHLARDGRLDINRDDEIVRDTLMTADGEVVHPKLRELLGLSPLQAAEAGQPDSGGAADRAAES